MTIFSKNLGGELPLSPPSWLRLWCVTAMHTFTTSSLQTFFANRA